MWVKLFPFIVGIIYMIYGFIYKEKIIIYNKIHNITLLNSKKFFQLQFYTSLIIFSLLILQGMLIIYFDLTIAYLIISPIIVVFSNYILRTICISKNIIK